MRRVLTIAGLAAATLLATPGAAQEQAGRWQVKVLGTAVLPDGAVEAVELDTVGLPASLQTAADDSYVPTVAIEYFVTPALSIETICCVTQHDVTGTAGLPGAELVADAKLIPATVTAKYHFNLGGISPYVGAGPAYFIFFDEQPGAATAPLGMTEQNLENAFGVAVQAGIDLPLNGRGLSASFDAKRYFIGTTATWYQGAMEKIRTEHKLDPWVLSAGLAMRF